LRIGLTALDWVNFFLADVRGGLGPFVIVYLVTKAHWSQATIGAVLSVSGIVGILAHPAIGAFIDRTRAKRAIVIIAAFVLAGCGMAILFEPSVPVVLVADVVMAILGGIFAPTVAAITLGLYGREALPERLGRNAAFDRAGNVFIAGFIGITGVTITPEAPFYFAPFFAVLTTIAVLAIPANAIDHERARGLETVNADHVPAPIGWRVLLHYRLLLVFAVIAAVFHFANAPMLPLVGQRLALANPGWETGFTSVAIIIAQLATIVMALLVARANGIGRRPLLILAFVALVLRCGLCAWFDDPVALLAVQILDGVGGGLFDTLLPLVLADIMRGTGHYSLARGALGAIHGIGGSSSQFVAGSIVVMMGYDVAFVTLGLVAAMGLLLVLLAMPETTPDRESAAVAPVNYPSSGRR
jgi:MFS family permease